VIGITTELTAANAAVTAITHGEGGCASDVTEITRLKDRRALAAPQSVCLGCATFAPSTPPGQTGILPPQ